MGYALQRSLPRSQLIHSVLDYCGLEVQSASISTILVVKLNDYLILDGYPPSSSSRIWVIIKSMKDSIFTKIIKGEIACHKIYEDDKTFAFLDIHPKQPGHTLVVPKKQIEFVWDLADEDYQALMTTVKKVAQRIRTVLGRPYVGELVVGIDVPHAHVHVFPFATAEESRFIPNLTAEPDHAALAVIAQKLAF